MSRFLLGSGVALLLIGVSGWAADSKYSIKPEKTKVPDEIKEPIAKVLSDQSIQLLDEDKKVVCEIWFRKELPSKAAPEQVKNGLTYRELEETTLLGAIRFVQPGGDYRKQKIKEGVYTLRLAFQPMDGDHMGTAPHSEFCLLVPADVDKGPDLLGTPKELQDLSTKATGTSHPGVFLLFPNDKPGEAPQLVDKGNGHWVLQIKQSVNAGKAKTSLGFALTLIGHTTAE